MNFQMQENQTARNRSGRGSFNRGDLGRRSLSENSSMRQQKPLSRVRDKNRQSLRLTNKTGRSIDKSARNSVEHSRRAGRVSIVVEPISKQEEYATLARRRPKKAHVLLAFGIFCVLLGKLVIRLEIMELSYKVEGMRNELLQQDAALRELKARKAVLANPRQLIQDATARLDLRGTRPQQIRRM